MGDQKYHTCKQLALGLAQLCDDRTLIVASSDLSHFHSYEEARELDLTLLSAIESWDYFMLSGNLALERWEACGGGPIVASMIAAELLGANRAQIVRYANSGDVPPGDKIRVVGYAAATFTADHEYRAEPDPLPLSREEQDLLLQLARQAVHAAVTGSTPPTLDRELSPALSQRAAVFVTLRKGGELRGCVGNILASGSVAQAALEAASNASTRDHRFESISVDELQTLEYQISILSRFRDLPSAEAIQIGKHGLYLEKGVSRGLLLPQVASEHGWDPLIFLDQTCIKAGLEVGSWRDPSCDIWYFSALVFGDRESELKAH
jgi:AmmeMemoRadiSam system protein A